MREANLLGVVGTDVSVEEIVKMVPQYKVSLRSAGVFIVRAIRSGIHSTLSLFCILILARGQRIRVYR